ncbi:MAG: CCA tRNA nucleotidyltransferase [Candidatus Micrarchaeia archaeon]
MVQKNKLIDDIFKQVLKDIKPTKEGYARTISKINMVTSNLKEIVPDNVEIMVTGSVSRGTNIKGNSDIDIFLLFRSGTTKEKLTSLGLSYGKALVKNKNDSYEIKYAEHPYVRVYLNSLGVKADIVPALKIQNLEEMATSVDRTPLHTKFINEELTEKQKDDVRLLKYFLKGHLIYGAESKTSGFSGYLCELLIYNLGSLKNLFEWSTTLKLPCLLNKGYEIKENEKESIFKKFNSDFVIIDPVDPNRNVAAVLSKESLSRFILASRKFINMPSKEYFTGLKFSSIQAKNYIDKFIKKTGLDLYLIKFKVPKKSEDIIWPQIKKCSNIISDYLTKNQFEVYFSLQWITDNNGAILLISPKQQRNSRLVTGPEITNDKAVSEFMASHKSSMAFIFLNSRIQSLEKAQFRGIKEALYSIKKNKQLYLHKDINLSKSDIYVNKVPKELRFDSSYELVKKFFI